MNRIEPLVLIAVGLMACGDPAGLTPSESPDFAAGGTPGAPVSFTFTFTLANPCTGEPIVFTVAARPVRGRNVDNPNGRRDHAVSMTRGTGIGAFGTSYTFAQHGSFGAQEFPQNTDIHAVQWTKVHGSEPGTSFVFFNNTHIAFDVNGQPHFVTEAHSRCR